MTRAVLLYALLGACVATVSQTADAGSPEEPIALPSGEVDLLIVVDNTGAQNWWNLPLMTSGLRGFAETLFVGSDGGSTERAAVSLHIGVMSSDLGTRDTFCSPPGGDGAVLNPARFGPAQRSRHGSAGVNNLPNNPGPCAEVDAYPRWLSLRAEDAGAGDVWLAASCMLNLGNFGCGATQPLEVLLRGATRERRSSSSSSPAFFRPDAVLVLMIVTTRDDASLRPCPEPGAGSTCPPTWLVLADTPEWPCSANDTTFSLTRYHDASGSSAGLPGLKPGHPERVLFAAFAGVPVEVDSSPEGDAPAWPTLLGAPGPGDGQDFCARDAGSAYMGVDAFGVVSMRPRTLDRTCPAPACRRRDPLRRAGIACEGVPVFRAARARRIAEIARRFDEAPICAGRPCRNGFVFSVCEDDFRPSMRALATRVRRRLAGAR